MANEDTKQNNTPLEQDEAKKESKKEVVEINKADLKQMLDQIKKLTDEQAALKDKLNAVADKNRLQQFDTKQAVGKSVMPTVKINTIDGKLIVGWRTVTNEAEFRNGVYFENQIIELTYSDGTSQKMTYLEFTRNKKQIPSTLRTRKHTEDSEIFEVEFADGQKLEINSLYIN